MVISNQAECYLSCVRVAEVFLVLKSPQEFLGGFFERHAESGVRLLKHLYWLL